MFHPLPDAALDQVFRAARTYYRWQPDAVPETLMRATYDLMKLGPTSGNCCPGRFVFISSEAGKERLKPHLDENNIIKATTSPWVVIIAHDLKFYDLVPKLFPHNPAAREWYTGPGVAEPHAFRNGSLQGAYFMLAARALGLDCGPMGGFNRETLDADFFKSDPATANWRSNFLCALGRGSQERVFPRSPRLDFEEACRIL